MAIGLFTAGFLLAAYGKANDKTESPNPADSVPEIIIGTQTWAAKNLDVSTFRNGVSIPEAKTKEEWLNAGAEGKPAWCYPDNDPDMGKKYGKLYNWYAVNDPRGLPPEGWHVASEAEWTTLTDHLGGERDAGTKMKAASGWNEADTSISRSGFAGLPGGWRSDLADFFDLGSGGYWWSSAEYSADSAWSHYLYSENTAEDRYYYSKRLGMSVRCLKD